MKTFEDFTKDCDNKRCPKRLTYNPKTCIKNYRREQCYRSYERSQEKQERKQTSDNEKENSFREQAWLNEVGFYNGVSKVDTDIAKKICSIWNILREDEKRFVESKFGTEFYYLIRTIDVCHIEDQSLAPEKEFDLENVYLGCRYFHTLLTQFKHPVTQVNITGDKVLSWNQAAKAKDRGMVIE